MMLTDLRERALRRVAGQLHPVQVCLDMGRLEAIEGAREALNDVRNREARLVEAVKPVSSKSLGKVSPRKELAAEIKECEVRLAEAEAAARIDSIFIQCRRLTPDEYETVIEPCAGKPTEVVIGTLWKLLAEACYVNTTDVEGVDLNLTYTDLTSKVLTHKDYETFVSFVFMLNRADTAIPFTQGNSGRTGTS
jgi:hypothetical protein